MQFFLPALALLASVAYAADCQQDLKYCAYTLVGKGDYHQQVNGAVSAYTNGALKTHHPDFFLFNCENSGAITVLQSCPSGCVDGGPDNSDHCR
ncbi:hypothetical protein N7471_013180 [Penicillium samsonianum]|uniref:uncharacterized protein n=1 Tax=Penicillium samsonianum TaxID=1882272 RepID=UPI0025488DB8|nr:uncharacterized protein N7471_013180 [Penicillium samsonianum]KAJ6118560.1 hypothetical protein N7471_013180 [Penicillium samsonianum]